MKRRTFLKRGLVTSGLLALAGSGLFLWPTRRGASPLGKLRVLDEREFWVMAAIAARTIRQPGANPIAIATEIDAELYLLAPELQKDTKAVLVLFDNALTGLLLDGRAGPFTRLSPEAQDGVLGSWRDSRIWVRRAGYHSLRKLTYSAFYRDPATWPLSHYPGPPTISPVPT